MKISSRPSAWRVVAVLLTLTAAAVLTVATPAPRATAATLCSNASCPNGPAYLAVINTSHWGQNSGHNCTNYVAWRLQSAAVPKFTGSGNALKWAGWASAAGYAVNGTPAPGAIAFWDGTTTRIARPRCDR